ncbi:hypothetical protein M9H77_23525 [Catharanthus roseus]|uniref:Uncharacterized protein n=1 Tax=Catharanthus roseus TaxID=4058 RepID=A0ACC0AW20_CATRO|nr:hypothetical protein M9H77_23525 [Catharanthus roseus]
MLSGIESMKKLSFERRISDGDLVTVYERRYMKVVKVCESGWLQNNFGVFKHSDWIGKPFGSKVFSNKGGFIHFVAPTPELWTIFLSHRTQILYKLASTLWAYFTFDFHEQRAASARDDFEKTGLSSLVTVGVKDIQGEGFPNEFSGLADPVFLDLPQPWLAIPSTGKILKQDGVLCSFSPCIEQVQRSCEMLKTCFTKHVRYFYSYLKCEKKSWRAGKNHGDGSLGSCKKGKYSIEVSHQQECNTSPAIMARPSTEGRGHTGYLTFARLKCIT